jgi:hypothetical protein
MVIMNKCGRTLRLRSFGCVTCSRKCSFPSPTGAHALHRFNEGIEYGAWKTVERVARTVITGATKYRVVTV